MLDRRRATLLDRAGRQLAGLTPGMRLGIALAGLTLFIGLSAIGWLAFADALADWLPAGTVVGASDRTPVPTRAAFGDRLARLTEITKGCFLDVGLSRDHFITQFSDPRQWGNQEFDFTYWEVWVPADFDVKRILEALRAYPGISGENVRFDYHQVDAKTHTIDMLVDGIATHRLLFTNAAEEAPRGARVLLANVPDDARTIDVGAIPEVRYQGAPQLAIIIDDIGFREAIDRMFIALPGAVTLSILPYGTSAKTIVAQAKQAGHEVMLHLPMEPLDMGQHDPGDGKLVLAMNDADIVRAVTADLDQVPGIVGVNNHMGSAFTRDARRMAVALGPIKQRGLFFIDSVTIGDSAAYRVARQQGMRAAARNLFLDHDPERASVARQLALAGRIARAQGQAIAIGHPFQNTLQALQEGLPALQAQGIELVPVSRLAR